MSSSDPLAKRIRRHVVGRPHVFFVASAPGLESLCLRELSSLPLARQEEAVVSGGVEFKGRLPDCYLANLQLRTANRVLMRIHGFKATNFNQLEKKLFDFPWELFLRSGPMPRIRISTKHCRLHHSGAIAQRLRASIAGRRLQVQGGGQADDRTAGQQLFIRGIDDHFTVSIDSSGENLYKRGLKKQSGRAPLRETMAAAALMFADYDGGEPLIDPLCGSGTFALEAAMMAQGIPPGWFRNFAFMGWPAFQPRRWEYLKRRSAAPTPSRKRPLIFASDKEPAACRVLEKCTRQFGLAEIINVACKDFFDLDPRHLTDTPGLVSINPPYGRRMGSRRESRELSDAICARLRKMFGGWKLVFFTPNLQLAQKLPGIAGIYPFWHGGLKLNLLVGRIR
ncbi:MAG: hypothetical protein JSW39_23565 [Desulfobacterales bacterium]|nr:MAG: hypothetical protein JSW39_23565 [Desulfobacterales bacterium]